MNSPLSRRALLGCTLGLTAASFVTSVSAQPAPWTLLDDASGPQARWDHVLLSDPAGDRLYLFGGRDGNGVALGDFWSFDLASGGWNLLDSPGPSPRFGPAAAKVPNDSGFLLFGGETAAEFFNDLWSFDFANQTWSLLDDGVGAAPSPRYGLGGDFDAAGRFVISHGFTFEGRFNDTWAFDTPQNAWLDVSPPAEARPLQRCLHEVVAVDGGKSLLLYAGCSSGYGPCPQGDLWSFDVSAGTWAQLSSEIVPAPRSNPAVAPANDGVLLVGGLTDGGPTSDVWRGELSDQGFLWSEVATATNIIPARSSHDLAAIGSDYFVFGGLGLNGAMADLWHYADS